MMQSLNCLINNELDKSDNALVQAEQKTKWEKTS
jgi:hypothetical protein